MDDARAPAYRLVGRLCRDGLRPDDLGVLRAVPELAEVLPEPFEADAAAADHFEVFRRGVLPYASVFLDAERRLGGAATETAQHARRAAGLPPPTEGEPADHLGHELDLLAHLTDAGDPPALRRFFDGHVLWWLPACAFALRRQPVPLYAAVADLALDLVLDHRAALGPTPPPSGAPPLAEPPDLLTDDATGLRDIAGYLATPAFSGLYLGRDDLRRLARAGEVPHGFGHRALLLENLLRAAASFDRLGALLDGLAADLRAWDDFYAALPTAGVPALAPIAAAWRARLAATAELLDHLRRASG